MLFDYRTNTTDVYTRETSRSSNWTVWPRGKLMKINTPVALINVPDHPKHDMVEEVKKYKKSLEVLKKLDLVSEQALNELSKDIDELANTAAMSCHWNSFTSSSSTAVTTRTFERIQEPSFTQADRITQSVALSTDALVTQFQQELKEDATQTQIHQLDLRKDTVVVIRQELDENSSELDSKHRFLVAIVHEDYTTDSNEIMVRMFRADKELVGKYKPLWHGVGKKSKAWVQSVWIQSIILTFRVEHPLKGISLSQEIKRQIIESFEISSSSQ